MNLRVLIIEDETLIAEDIKMQVEKIGVACVGICDNKADAVELAKSLRPDFALVDINLNNNFLGIEIAKELRFNHGIQIIFITSYSNDSFIEEAEKINPVDYLVKPFLPKQLEVSIKRISLRNNNDNYAAIDINVFNEKLPVALTNSEFAVWKELSMGKSNKEISETLFISENTVKTHLKSLFIKLECSQRSKAVQIFFKLTGLL
jgi:DNA-binding NarL/FixJ family response regulator